MSFADTKRDFSIAFYLWAKQSFEQEVASDFPLLKTIPLCVPLIDFFRHLSDRQQLIAIATFCKTGHSGAAGLLGERKTSEEAELLRQYGEFRNRSRLDPSRAESKLEALSQKFDRVAFTKALESEIGPLLGCLVEKGGQSHRKYSKEFETFTIETWIFTGGPVRQLQYEHKLLAPEGAIFEHISILSWLGIVLGPTPWRPLSDDTSESVIKACKEACSMFINAAPKLVKS